MNILLVEDDHDCRAYLGNFLRKHGHQVVECENGCGALDSFQSGEFHMILSDIKMPGMDGIELLHSIKSMPSGQVVDVVLFTGHGDVELAIEALRAGAYDYLLKPINLKEITVVTERVAEHQALCRENKILNERFEEEVKAATQETLHELTRYKEAYARTVGLEKVVIFSDNMKDIFRQADKLHTDRTIPVLIQGETGTGKEVVARYIHYGNLEDTAPFVDINCPALNANIFESELFGYEAGAFTGGLPTGQKGKLDTAMGGTIFFDEIAELSTDLQAKLLRFIQYREYYRVGGLKKINADVRIICASNVDIQEAVKQGTFRQDLYYRLNVGRLYIPPLRKRTEEILPLANEFLKELAPKRGKRFVRISDSAAGILLSYSWPGNIRELRNVIEWVTFMHDDLEVKPPHLGILPILQLEQSLPEGIQPYVLDEIPLPAGGFDVEGFVNKTVQRALEMHNGNKAKTARYLGISRHALYCRLERMGLQLSSKGNCP